jgi:hypothetical protein
MLGDVDGGPAIFPAKGNALKDAKDDEGYGSGRTCLRVGRDKADEEGRTPHQGDGDEECVLAAELVADDAEDERSKGTEGKTCSEQRKGRDQNTFEMTGARLPKMKKSYHSKAVPAEDAMITRAIDQGLCSCFSAMVAIRHSPWLVR